MIFKELIKKYNEDYKISKKDSADFAESNRLSALVVAAVLLLSDIIDWIVVLVSHHANLADYMHYIIYLGVYTPLNLYILLHARHAKESSPRVKNIPIYLVLFVGLSASVFNFYFMGNQGSGFVTYYLSGFLFLIFFSVSPLVFLVEILPFLCILLPGVYKTFGLYTMIDGLVVTAIMFAVALYKRNYEKKLVTLLKRQKKVLEAKTFGNFTLIYEGKAIGFSRSKSEELLAYLIYKNGTSSNTRELISVLWGERADSARYGSNLRNLIVDIKHTLKENEIQDFFISEYNNFRINPEVIRCDYYDFLAGDTHAIKSFIGEFMNQYSWAEEIAALLEQKVQ